MVPYACLFIYLLGVPYWLQLCPWHLGNKVSSQIFSAIVPKDVHALCSEPENRLCYMAKNNFTNVMKGTPVMANFLELQWWQTAGHAIRAKSSSPLIQALKWKIILGYLVTGIFEKEPCSVWSAGEDTKEKSQLGTAKLPVRQRKQARDPGLWSTSGMASEWRIPLSLQKTTKPLWHLRA